MYILYTFIYIYIYTIPIHFYTIYTKKEKTKLKKKTKKKKKTKQKLKLYNNSDLLSSKAHTLNPLFDGLFVSSFDLSVHINITF